MRRATGLTLELPVEYEQLWWSWHGSETREVDDTWSPRGALVITSLNAEQAAQVARIQSRGGPGAGISQDEATGLPILPGDALIDAQIVP